MEGGFRRLWSRKKSVSSVDPQSRSRDVSSSNGFDSLQQSPYPVIKDGRTSTLSSRDPYSYASGEDLSRIKSGHRIQPMLVGISRPDTGNNRPGTSGSLQTAVQSAGDSVGRPSDVSAHLPKPIPGSLRPHARHVDIFSVASSKPSYTSRYNEEIAERNLDTYRLVLENTPYVYNPSSKFQEEVAIRNAYLPYKSRPSTDSLRRSSDHGRTASSTTRSVRSVVSPQPNGVHTRQPNVHPTASSQELPKDEAVHYLHHTPQRSRDEILIPAIPPEQGEEQVFMGDTGFKVVTREDGFKILTHASYAPRHAAGANAVLRDDRMQTINEGQAYETRSSTATTTATPRDSSQSTSSNVFSDYKVSTAEYGVSSASERSMLDVKPDPRTITGPPSVRSETSSIQRTLIIPKRTIMDLTNEESELVSETSSAIGYPNYSPVISQARSNAFQRVEPSQIHTEERRGSKGPVQMIEATRSVVNPDNTKSLPKAIDTAQAVQKSPTFSSFSPINTLASWSPRSSAYVAETVEPQSMSERVASALKTSRAIANAEPLPVSDTSGNETPTVKERVANLESSRDRSISPPTSAKEIKSSATQPIVIPSTETPSKAITRQAEPETNQIPAATTNGDVSSTPAIYTSPSSITSVDYVNPGTTFGVRTRDFALSPQGDTPSAKKGKLPTLSEQPRTANSASKLEPRPKASKPRTKTATPVGAGAVPAGSTFDEEAFKRKQAEARAALERLQRSLSEDFMTLPDRASVQSPKGKGKEADKNVRSAPSLVLPETKLTAPPIVRLESDKLPPSSFRTARSEATKSIPPSNPRSLSAGRSSKRAAVPPSLKNIEPATVPVDAGMLSPSLLKALQLGSQPPRSPGEISLSSFPVPSSSRPPSQPDAPAGLHFQNNPIVGAMKRRSSTKSQNSIASAFSIPYHMVPGRTSSFRDPVPEEVDPIWG